jgi:carboxyl-terminal processing protease
MNNNPRQLIALIVLLFIGFNPLSSQTRIPIDSLYQVIKSKSFYQHTASWDAIDVEFRDCIQRQKGDLDIIKCFIKVFENSNDFQSSIVYKGKEYSVHSSDFQNAKTVSSTEDATPLIIKTQLLKDNNVYILISGNNKLFDNNKTAQAIADSINQYQKKSVKGIVVDLRLMHSGHFPSVISGLHSLLGSEVLGYDIDSDGKKANTWQLINGNFKDHSCQITTMNNKSDAFSKTPVVVLIGHGTKNAGVLTALAFKNRPQTTVIGEATTTGYVGSTVFYKISRDLSLHLTQYIGADRKGRIYPRYIPPDIQVGGADHYSEPENDKKVKAALRFLAKYQK